MRAAAKVLFSAQLTLVLGGEMLVERAKIDYHSLMKAVAISSSRRGRNLEFNSLSFDLDDLGFGSNIGGPPA